MAAAYGFPWAQATGAADRVISVSIAFDPMFKSKLGRRDASVKHPAHGIGGPGLRLRLFAHRINVADRRPLGD